jgi:hypothetical protein
MRTAVAIVLILGRYACKKDSTKTSTATSTTSTPPNSFVEYRDAFTGTYVGTLYNQSGKTVTGVIWQPEDTTENASVTISKSLTNDSLLEGVQCPILIRQNGTGLASNCRGAYYIYPCKFTQGSIYYYTEWSLSGYVYRKRFIGKKQ